MATIHFTRSNKHAETPHYQKWQFLGGEPLDTNPAFPFFAGYQLPALAADLPELRIPPGAPATIDGKAEGEEWSSALTVDFSGGETLMMMHDGRYLYLYIKGENPGVASVGLCTRDSVRILHASAGLITAVYVPEGEHWRQVEPFRSARQMAGRRGADSSWEMQINLKEYGWCATVLPRIPDDTFDMSLATEYKVSLDLLKSGSSAMSLAFFQREAKQTMAYSPPGLADDALKRSMVLGANHELLDFDTDSWMILSW